MNNNNQASSECERQRDAFIEKLIEIIRKSEKAPNTESSSTQTQS